MTAHDSIVALLGFLGLGGSLVLAFQGQLIGAGIVLLLGLTFLKEVGEG